MTGSTRRLSDVARHLVIPEGIVTSQFPRVYRRLLDVGVSFDQWQQGFGTVALGCRESGKYAASIGGVVASIPRQVGKTYTVGNLIIGLCLEFPNLRAIWTSHHNRTTTNTFRSMQSMVRREKLWPHIAPNGIRTANGEQEIRFANGSIIMFGAREQGFGRGMDAIDVEVFDEAQILGVKALEDMVPATNAARHEHGGLVFFIGTPPRPTDDGDAFTSKRKKALAGLTLHQVYCEISADPDTEPDDQSKFHTFNPSYPHRTPLDAMLRMRENIPDEDSWRREAMGIWPPDTDADDTEHVIDLEQWSDMGKAAPALTGSIALAVDMTPDRKWCSIAAAQRVADGAVHVEVGFHQAPSDEVVPFIIRLIERWEPCALVIDKQSPAMTLVNPLLQAGIEAETTTTTEFVQACGNFYDDAVNAKLSHTGDPLLYGAIEAAHWRDLAGGRAWNRKGQAQISPLVAASLAHYGLLTFGSRVVVPPASPAMDTDLMDVDELDIMGAF
ncbi:terminase [Rhodococcus sp. 06-418-5]|nr:terminase [Rhodococcus sp. 06-418-5]